MNKLANKINDVCLKTLTTQRLKQYQKKRDDICKKFNIPITTLSRGLASLIQKELLLKENQNYSIHYRLIAYMRLKSECDYATTIHEIKIR